MDSSAISGPDSVLGNPMASRDTRHACPESSFCYIWTTVATSGQQLLHLDNSWSTFVHTVPVDYGCLDNTWYICTCTTTVLVDPDSKSHASVNLMIIINCFSEFIDHVPRLCPKFLSDETICTFSHRWNDSPSGKAASWVESSCKSSDMLFHSACATRRPPRREASGKMDPFCIDA